MLNVFQTSNNPQKGLSRETHRVGYHFPSITVEKACMSLGVSLTTSGRVSDSSFALLDEGSTWHRPIHHQQAVKKRKPGARHDSPTMDVNLSQAVIDTQAREAIKDLFPKIPSVDLHAIVGRSFQKVFAYPALSNYVLSLLGKGLSRYGRRHEPCP